VKSPFGSQFSFKADRTVVIPVMDDLLRKWFNKVKQ